MDLGPLSPLELVYVPRLHDSVSRLVGVVAKGCTPLVRSAHGPRFPERVLRVSLPPPKWPIKNITLDCEHLPPLRKESMHPKDELVPVSRSCASVAYPSRLTFVPARPLMIVLPTRNFSCAFSTTRWSDEMLGNSSKGYAGRALTHNARSKISLSTRSCRRAKLSTWPHAALFGNTRTWHSSVRLA